jgi:hypothetical protein
LVHLSGAGHREVQEECAARKKREYLRRRLKARKISYEEYLLKEPPFFPKLPPHRTKDDSFLFIYDLVKTIKEAGLPNPYEEVGHLLYNFFNITIEADSVKREFLRQKKDPTIKRQEEREERSVTKCYLQQDKGS